MKLSRDGAPRGSRPSTVCISFQKPNTKSGLHRYREREKGLALRVCKQRDLFHRELAFLVVHPRPSLYFSLNQHIARVQIR